MTPKPPSLTAPDPTLVTCPGCGTTGFTPDGLKRHRCKGVNRNPQPAPDPLLAAAGRHYAAAAAALRQSCAEALLTGLHLIALHARSVSTGGVRMAGSTGDGFTSALEQIGIPERTAYRWMTACRNALARVTLVFPDEEPELPAHGTPAWENWEKHLRGLAEGMSLSRLMIGAAKASSEDHRYDELLSKSESGAGRSADLLAAVAEGKYTLVQAVKALGSQEAYDRLRSDGGEKIRRDPVYLDYDPVAKCPVGLIPKAFVTLHNGFRNWDDYDPDARTAMRRQFLEVIKTAPRELTDLLLKK
jgi:hypothetical protein